MGKPRGGKPKTLADCTQKELNFIEEYMLDLNAKQAARRAGYTEKSCGQQAGRLMRDPVIKQEIDRQIGIRTKLNEVTVDRILQEYKALAYSSLLDILVKKRGKYVLKDLDAITPEQAACISEVKINDDGTLTVKLHSKTSALKDLGSYKKMFTDRLEVSGVDGEPVKVQQVVDEVKEMFEDD